ncbi:hypothetical protein ACS0TY_006111 [Phlomoides rotata]
MSDFREVVASLNLLDMGFQGSKYTWSNGRPGNENIQSRLDRVLATTQWHNLFPSHMVHHRPWLHSDHSPLIVFFDEIQGLEGTHKK